MPKVSLPKIDTVYVDMDDTLVGFLSYCMREMSVERHELTHSGIGALMDEQAPHGMFSCLEPMPDFHIMRALISSLERTGHRVLIMSKIGQHSYSRQIARDKNTWLEKHHLQHLNRVYVETNTLKGEFGNQNSMLIDDNSDCTSPFADRGGFAILHREAAVTVAQVLSRCEILDHDRQYLKNLIFEYHGNSPAAV